MKWWIWKRRCTHARCNSRETASLGVLVQLGRGYNQCELLDDVSYLDFLHHILPTWVLGEIPNREDISTLRLLACLPIRHPDSVSPKTTIA